MGFDALEVFAQCWLLRYTVSYIEDLKTSRVFFHPSRLTLSPLADRCDEKDQMIRNRHSGGYLVAADPDDMIDCLPTCVRYNITADMSQVRNDNITGRDQGFGVEAHELRLALLHHISVQVRGIPENT